VIVLAVHTTTPCLSVAVVEDGRLLAERTLPPGREHLENLVPLIKTVIAELRLTLKQIDGLAVAVGPGSFSGIRVGMSVVKGIALALCKPAVGISSLEILASGRLHIGEIGVAVIDARRGESYAALYEKRDNGLILLEGPMLTKTENLLKTVGERPGKLAVCTGQEMLDLHGPEDTDVRRVGLTGSAAICALLAEQRLRGGDAGSVHMLAPLYVRRSDAEQKKAIVPTKGSNAQD